MLSEADIQRVVHRYIGVEGGYLNGFSYASHDEFYPLFCGLNIRPSELRTRRGGGTTRELFVEILRNAPARDQAKTLRGILDKFPLDSFREAERAARAELRQQIEQMILRLEASSVDAPTLESASAVVARALSDAQELLRTNGPVSVVDRLHTALHAFLREACNAAAIAIEPDASIVRAYSALLDRHPALQAQGSHAEELRRILRSASAILDAVNTLRNRGSIAHPNDLLTEVDARLVVDVVHTLFRYLSSKLRPQGTV